MYCASNCSTLQKRYHWWNIKPNERCNQEDYQATLYSKTESNKKEASFPNICSFKPVLCRLAGDDHSSRPSSHAAASCRGPDSSINCLRVSTRRPRKTRVVQAIVTPLSVPSHICGSTRSFHLHWDGSSDQMPRRIVQYRVCDCLAY